MRESAKPAGWALAIYALVRDTQGRILMLQRSKKRTYFPSLWELPGGKPAVKESFNETALIEAFEETGLDITLTGVAGAAESSAGDTRVALLILEATASSTAVTLSSAHDNYAWITLEETRAIPLRPGFDVFFDGYGKG